MVIFSVSYLSASTKWRIHTFSPSCNCHVLFSFNIVQSGLLLIPGTPSCVYMHICVCVCESCEKHAHMLPLSRTTQSQRLINTALHMDKLDEDEKSQVSAPH